MISRASFDAYCSDVEGLKARAAEVAEKAVGAWLRANPDADVSEVREGIKDVLASIAESFDGAAATMAAEWYDESAELAHAKLPSAVTETAYAPEQVDATVRYQVRKLIEGDRAAFAAACADLVRDQVSRSVNETVMANAKRDRKRGVRFARIATGSETCAFCYMLASRGAVYHNRKTAGEFKHFHRHCDCKVVPGFEDDPLAVLVEGHDPSVMVDRLYEIEQQTGLSFANKNDLSKLSDYMAMLDRGWLYDGKDASYSMESGARFRPHEIATAEALAAHGISCVFRHTRESVGKKTSDVFIQGVPWEFKRPTGSGKNNINNQFNEASGQSDKLVIDARASPFGFDAVAVKALEILTRRDDFTEVIVLGPDRLVWIKK